MPFSTADRPASPVVEALPCSPGQGKGDSARQRLIPAIDVWAQMNAPGFVHPDGVVDHAHLHLARQVRRFALTEGDLPAD